MYGPQRRPLERNSVITLVVVLFFLASLVPAQLFQVREAARRTQCAKNLMLVALNVHEFHDVNNFFPPLATDEGQWTWTALVLPYLERGRTYARIDWKEPSAKTEAHKKLVAEFKSEVLLCPSRRTDKDTSIRKEGDFKGGQPTDYIAVSTTDLKRFSGKTNGMIIFRKQPRDDSRKQPLRSYTTFGSVFDGNSKTAMIGEKHMLQDWLGGKYDEPALVAFNDQNTIRIASDIEKNKEDGEEIKKPRGLAADPTRLRMGKKKTTPKQIQTTGNSAARIQKSANSPSGMPAFTPSPNPRTPACSAGCAAGMMARCMSCRSEPTAVRHSSQRIL
jgi:hypothetical protein